VGFCGAAGAVASFCAFDCVAWFGALWRVDECGTETPRHRVGDEVGGGVVGRAHIDPLLRGVVLRDWDVARAAKGEKGGFFGGYWGLFFNFSKWGEVRAQGFRMSGLIDEAPLKAEQAIIAVEEEIVPPDAHSHGTARDPIHLAGLNDRIVDLLEVGGEGADAIRRVVLLRPAVDGAGFDLRGLAEGGRRFFASHSGSIDLGEFGSCGIVRAAAGEGEEAEGEQAESTFAFH
jgi:sulfur carrier protein ThiS